jgi:hypothetical protein
VLSSLPPQQVDWVPIEVHELVGTAAVGVGDTAEACGSPESQISQTPAGSEDDLGRRAGPDKPRAPKRPPDQKATSARFGAPLRGGGAGVPR